MPHGDLDGEAHSGASVVLGGEEVSGEVVVGLVLHVQLAGAHILELRVVDALLRNDLATDEEDTSDLEVGHLTEHAHLTEGVLTEAIETLHEALKKVGEDVVDLSLLADLLVVEMPEGVALQIDHLHESLPAGASLVGVVHVECLEVEEIEGAGRQSI